MRLPAWLERGRVIGRSAPIAVALLVAANLVPLAGVLLLGWDVATILIIYWIENGIVGLFNVPKILLAAAPPEARAGAPLALAQPVAGPFLAPFFVLNYGIFWIGHGVFVMLLTGGFAFGMLDSMRAVVAEPPFVLAAAGLLLSHGASFVLNFLSRHEYLNMSPQAQFIQPYPRMIVLHLTIIASGFVLNLLGQPVVLLALLVLFKTAFDLQLHLREHARIRERSLQSVASGTAAGVERG